MRIYEYPQAERAPLETEEIDQQRETEERRKDNELCAEIAQRKRVAAERGIKLTVVLLASRKMLGAWCEFLARMHSHCPHR